MGCGCYPLFVGKIGGRFHGFIRTFGCGCVRCFWFFGCVHGERLANRKFLHNTLVKDFLHVVVQNVEEIAVFELVLAVRLCDGLDEIVVAVTDLSCVPKGRFDGFR